MESRIPLASNDRESIHVIGIIRQKAPNKVFLRDLKEEPWEESVPLIGVGPAIVIETTEHYAGTLPHASDLSKMLQDSGCDLELLLCEALKTNLTSAGFTAKIIDLRNHDYARRWERHLIHAQEDAAIVCDATRHARDYAALAALGEADAYLDPGIISPWFRRDTKQGFAVYIRMFPRLISSDGKKFLYRDRIGGYNGIYRFKNFEEIINNKQQAIEALKYAVLVLADFISADLTPPKK